MAVANSGNKANFPSWNQQAVFFEEISYPAKWQDLSDEVLAANYRQLILEGQPSSEAQLIICFLMKRHKTPIVLISRKYTRSLEDFEDFLHDLYEKLLRVMARQEELQNFGGFLSRMIHNMHLDAIKKKKPDVGIEDLAPRNTGDYGQRSVDLRMDYPLDEAAIQKLVEGGLLSTREGLVMNLVLSEYKPREMVELISDASLGIKPSVPPFDPAEKTKKKIAKIYSAIERARKKLNSHFSR